MKTDVEVAKISNNLLDRITHAPENVDANRVEMFNTLHAVYSEGYSAGRAVPVNMQEGLWAEATDHKVTQYNEPVLFAIRYHHNQDGVMREVLCANEHAVQAELHVLLLRNDSAGIAVVRVNRE